MNNLKNNRRRRGRRSGGEEVRRRRRSSSGEMRPEGPETVGAKEGDGRERGRLRAGGINRLQDGHWNNVPNLSFPRLVAPKVQCWSLHLWLRELSCSLMICLLCHRQVCVFTVPI